jgi:hypothetical protein
VKGFSTWRRRQEFERRRIVALWLITFTLIAAITVQAALLMVISHLGRL